MINVPMIDTPLWQPTHEQVAHSAMYRLMTQCGQDTYEDLYTYSVTQSENFWAKVWDFCGVIGEKGSDRVLLNADNMEKASFFPDARLNYAQNLLRRRDEVPAVFFYTENKRTQVLSWKELYSQVARVADHLTRWGVEPGDRVAAYMPNAPETLIAFLAAASIGAVWSSCSPDFGVPGVVDRFGQIAPKVLLIADGYYYNGKAYPYLERLAEIRQSIPSIQHVVVVPYLTSSDAPQFTEASCGGPVEIWSELLATSTAETISFKMLPFNHPLYILYSSGTTGVPKCIVHRAGGVLIQHLKEHQLHCDLTPADVLFYFTTCGWMMWNWLVSGLATGCPIVLYDGAPTFPHVTRLFELIDEVKITVFGTSAKFIDALAKSGALPKQTYDLQSLRMITSTGSPLSPEGFRYVYKSVKASICLASISGGTDIVSCFALGNPMKPVWVGELQTRGLGMAVDVFNEKGESVQGEKGELVCTKPFPSQPLGFWGDETGKKYHQAYYARFPNVWCHGDFVELTQHQGLIIHGRSDAVLNPGGVRIGTAEIYRQVEKIADVQESIAVGQNWQNDVRVVLFVKLAEGVVLTDALVAAIKQEIRTHTTPRHVPAKIIQVPDIPRTKNGKIAEIAVRQAIHHEVVKNKEALLNPDILVYYQNIDSLLKE